MSKESKLYTCAVDKNTDLLEVSQFMLSRNGAWTERGVHVIARQRIGASVTQATMVLSQSDCIDLATRLMAWAMHGVEIGEENKA